MLGQSLLTVDEWYERWFGALLHEGAVAHLGYARRLMLVPVAVVGQAIAAAALPTLSRLWAEGKREALDRLVLRTLQAGISIAVLASVAFTLFAREVVVLIYQRGAFTAADTAAVASILSLLALAVPAWITQQIAARAFYARGDTWRPMLLGTGIALAAIPLYLELGRLWGVTGLAAAGVIGMSANALATLALARWLHGAPALAALGSTAARAAAIAVVAAVAARLPVPYATPSLASAALVNLLLGGSVFLVLGVAGLFTLGDQATRDAVRRRLRRGAPSVDRPPTPDP
jgi:putative peptidoglycan lipid II flippase